VVKYKSVLKSKHLVLKTTTKILKDYPPLESTENLMKLPTYSIRNFEKRQEKTISVTFTELSCMFGQTFSLINP
jgi:uncharacterized protein (UPF0276 family)